MAAFNQAIAAIALGDGAATEVFTKLPTVNIDPSPVVERDDYYSVADVSGGVANRRTAIGGVGEDITVEMELKHDSAATPALITAVSTISALEGAANPTLERNFVKVFPSGRMTKALYLITDVKNFRGATQAGAGRVTFKLARQGADAAYSGTVS